MLRSRVGTIVIGVIIGAVVAGGISYAAIPHSKTKQITACILKSGANKGATRIIDAQRGATCRSTETKIEWAATGVNWRGSWTSSATYNANDSVYYQGTSYRAKRTNTNIVPGTSGSDWLYLARAGAAGPAGPSGVDATLDRPGHTVTRVADGGFSMAATVGVDGLAIFAHNAATELWVTHCDNVACTESTTTVVDDPVDTVGGGPSIAIGADGLPAIAHRNETTSALRLTRCHDAACTSGTSGDIDDPVGGAGNYSSIAIGTDGNPIISHHDGASDGVRITHCDDDSCAASTTIVYLPGIGSLDATSIASGIDGLAVIAVQDGVSDATRVLHCNSVDCSSVFAVFVDEAGDFTGLFPDVAIGADGLPVIVSSNFADFTLRVLRCESFNCSSTSGTTVTQSTDNIGFYPKVAIAPDGVPVVAHVDATNEAILVTRCTDASCASSQTVTVEDPGFSVQYAIAIVIGSDGQPLVGFMDFGNGGLWVAHCSNRFCVPHAAT